MNNVPLKSLDLGIRHVISALRAEAKKCNDRADVLESFLDEPRGGISKLRRSGGVKALSMEGRARIAAAQKRRWADFHKQSGKRGRASKAGAV